MKLYADTPARRTRQLVGDGLALGWTVFWVWAATRLHAVVSSLAEPGIVLEDAGIGMNDRVLAAADAVDGLPVVGDELRTPFEVVADAGTSIAAAGQRQQDVVADVAAALSGLVLFLALALVLLTWLPRRAAWVKRTSVARTLVQGGGGSSLFALRALATRPLTELHRIDPDPAGAWQRGDPRVIDALAELELAALGLRPSVRPPPQPASRSDDETFGSDPAMHPPSRDEWDRG